MGKKDAPPPPDYAAAAKEQGAANLTAGQQTAALNRPNQIDSNGSQTWSMREGADPKNPQAGDWVVTNKLNDTQQALKDQQDQLSSQYGDLAKSSLTSIGSTLGTKFDASGLPQAHGLDTSGMQAMATAPGAVQHEMMNGPASHELMGGPATHQDVSLGSEASRQKVQDALYARSTSMLDPQIHQQNSDLESRLAAQGITAGSAAYQREMDNQSRQSTDQYARARQDAILAGGAEDSRVGNLTLAQTGFNNDNRDTAFTQGMASKGFNNGVADTEFNQNVTSKGFNNNAMDTSYTQGMQGAQMDNAVRAQQFGENQASTQVDNTLHSNALAEALQQRQLGLNEANALRTGNQVGNYNFQAYGGGGQVAASPVMQGVTEGYNAQLAGVNADNAASGSMWKGLTSLGGAAIGKWG